MVERGSVPFESCSPRELVHGSGAGLDTRYDTTTQIAFMNRRGTEPYARWCGRTAGVTPPPTRLRQTNAVAEGGVSELLCGESWAFRPASSTSGGPRPSSSKMSQPESRPWLELLDLATQASQFFLFGAGRPIVTMSRITVGLLHPVMDGLSGGFELLG